MQLHCCTHAFLIKIWILPPFPNKPAAVDMHWDESESQLFALKGLQTIALKFQWSNVEGIALSMKTKRYVICFQHLFSAMFHLYSQVISLPLSPIQATLHPKSLLQWTALGHRSSPEGLYSIWKFSESYFKGPNVHSLHSWHVFSHSVMKPAILNTYNSLECYRPTLSSD